MARYNTDYMAKCSSDHKAFVMAEKTEAFEGEGEKAIVTYVLMTTPSWMLC